MMGGRENVRIPREARSRIRDSREVRISRTTIDFAVLP